MDIDALIRIVPWTELHVFQCPRWRVHQLAREACDEFSTPERAGDVPLGLVATAADDAGAPIFADPTDDEPVAWLPAQQRYGGTEVPVVEHYEHWSRVLLVGRQAAAGAGDARQLTGWLRASDIAVSENDARIEVDLAASTIEIVTGGVAVDPETATFAQSDRDWSDDGGTHADDGSAPRTDGIELTEETRETIAIDFAQGTDATRTPLGRSFVMMTEVTSFSYTRGHPIVYLSVQSQDLAGFGGQDVAITAFHYHDARSGAISNGCIRVDADAIERLAALPAGTEVVIR